MKRLLFIIMIMAFAMEASAKGKRIVILHTNDTHSCVYPLNSNLADTMLAGRGGFVRRAVMVKAERKKNPALLLLDSGDFSQGSSYYTLFKGDVEVGLMNMMGYDAAAIGNHEFDFGLDNMARIFRMAEFPVVCANYHFEGTAVEGLVKPYVVLERKGLKIGVFGLGTQLEGMVAAENYKGVTYEDPIVAANRVATELKEKEHCDLVVCLSHLGWDIEGVDDTELIPASHHIDVVLGGHSHSYFEKPVFYENLDGEEVPLQQMGKNGVFVGMMQLELEKE